MTYQSAGDRRLFPLTAMFLMGIMMMASQAQAMPAMLLSEASQKYEANDFEGAAQIYEGLLDQGFVNENVYYNLGNAYYRLGFRGKAIWAYESAHLWAPRDEDVLWNLHLMRKSLVDEAQGGDSPVFQLAGLWREHLSPNETAGLCFISAFLFFFFSLLFILFEGGRALTKRLIAVSALALLILGPASALLTYERRFARAVIHEREVYARYGPSGQDTKAFLLHEGTTVRISKRSGEWISIQFGASQKGWLPRSSVRVIG